MNTAIYDVLVRAAKERKLLTYRDVARAADMNISVPEDVVTIGKLLDEIAEHEFAEGRPLLAILVVSSDTGMPGGGLFKFSRVRGIQAKRIDNVTFFAEEVQKVYSYWARASP